MRVTLVVRASHVHKPLINFLGKRTWGAVEPHDPQPHPQAPNHELPKPVTDFKKYRANAQQHGPLARSGHFPSRQVTMSGAGSPDSAGVVLDRNELPARFRRMTLTPKEIEYIESGGATLIW